jgi:hypothetical protein
MAVATDKLPNEIQLGNFFVVARLFRGEVFLANHEKNPASEDTGYNNQRH